MSTESSAVSDLIRLQHTRRLRTDPADAFLFQAPENARPRSRREPMRAFDVAPGVAPAPSVETAATRPSRPIAPVKRRSWPFLMAMLVAAGAGVAIAAYSDLVTGAETGAAFDMAAFVPAPPPPPAPAPSVAPIVAPAPTAEAAPAEPAPAEAPPAEAPVAAAPPAPTTHHAKKHVAKKHAKIVKAAKAKPAPEPVAEEAPAPPPPPATHAPKRPITQAADKENPL